MEDSSGRLRWIRVMVYQIGGFWAQGEVGEEDVAVVGEEETGEREADA